MSDAALARAMTQRLWSAGNGVHSQESDEGSRHADQRLLHAELPLDSQDIGLRSVGVQDPELHCATREVRRCVDALIGFTCHR